MSTDLFLALLGFAAVTLFTPGPNNLMLMASGTNYGYRRTLPHLAGVSLGFGAMVFLVGVGLMVLFEQVPGLQTGLKIAAILYLGWLAWKIANAAPPEGREGASGRPMSFLQAVAFQWVNPKGWSMALSSVAAFAPDHGFAPVAVITTVFALVNLPSASLWTLLGREMRRWLTNPRRLMLFNRTMALLLVATLVPVLAA